MDRKRLIKLIKKNIGLMWDKILCLILSLYLLVEAPWSFNIVLNIIIKPILLFIALVAILTVYDYIFEEDK